MSMPLWQILADSRKIFSITRRKISYGSSFWTGLSMYNATSLAGGAGSAPMCERQNFYYKLLLARRAKQFGAK
jgi:hypothetical protein